jgi:hypothetical protein
MAENEVVYEVNGKQTKFTYRRITFREYQKAMSSVGNVELLGGTTRSKFDLIKVMDEIMKASVVGESGADFHDLSVVDGTDLQNRVMVLNGLGGGVEPFRSGESG